MSTETEKAEAAKAEAAKKAEAEAVAAAAAAEEDKETFDRDYVHKLREEIKGVRTKYRTLLEEAETRRTKEEEASKATLAEQGKYKELYEKLKGEADTKFSALAKFQEAEAKRREALVEKLPEEKRELYATASTDVLADIVETLEAAKGEPMPGAKPGKGTAQKKFEELTAGEKVALKAADPAQYRLRYREWYKRVNGREPPFDPIG